MKNLSSEKIHWLKNHVPASHAEYMEISAAANTMPGRFPKMLYLEVGWECNLDCTFCSKPSRRKPSRLMELADYERVLVECSESGLYYLNLHFFNEPLLHLDMLMPVIRRAKALGIPMVAVTTNATPLTRDVMVGLRDAGLDALHVSFEGADAKVYERVRGVKSRTVAARVTAAAAVPKRPYMTICLMRTTETDEQIVAFGEIWSRVVDKVEIRPVLEFLGRIQEPEHAVIPDHRIPCRYLGDRLAILSDGTFTGCSVDVDGDLRLGNVLDGDTVSGVWNSEGYRWLWSMHAFQEWEGLPEPCRSCKSWDFTATDRSERYVCGKRSV